MSPGAQAPAQRLHRADVFCRVVDNLGDAGVCWRLARQLAAEHGLAVRLWIDRPRVLARLGADAAEAARVGVALRAWPERWLPDAPGPADLVVAAFACRLPEPYLDAMAARTPQPAWFNLEYLSAEPWVADAHGLASPRPDRPLVERFFFPGFDARTGGLLRERDLLARRDAFTADAGAQAALCAALGVAPRQPGETLVSMFCYPHAPLARLLAAWREAGRPVRVLLPEGVGGEALAAVFGQPAAAAGTRCRAGALAVDVIGLVPQPRYDELLWLCDVNFVRGEDSFVRAQWAARPFVWNVYPQDGGADRVKLDAFLARCLGPARSSEPGRRAEPNGSMPRGPLASADALEHAAGAVRALMHAWNGDGDIARAWRDFDAVRPEAAQLAARWCAALAAQPDLAAQLLGRAQKQLADQSEKMLGFKALL